MKTILPWILAVAFAAGAASLYYSNSTKNDELTSLRPQVAKIDELNSQLEDLQKKAAAQDEQIAAMHKDNAELLSLRNQVRQLADEKAQLTKQMQAAQSLAARSQAEVQTVQARAAENVKAMQEQQILQARQNQAVVGTCINNLRIIDGAKQQWALQNQKGANDVPQPQEILPFLPNNMMPQCPGGGRYTLNAVNKAPTCTIPGHTL